MPADMLPGRTDPIETATHHFVNGRSLAEPWPADLEIAIFGMGCYWGVERLFWQTEGVELTQVGFAGGNTPNPTYKESCTGNTGHTEVVKIGFNPAKISYERLLQIFWEGHDPTQGDRQGNDIGSQYRSAIFTTNDDQMAAANATCAEFQKQLDAAGMGPITTEIAKAGDFFPAHEDHQQYLARYPEGYCGLKGTGVVCPI